MVDSHPSEDAILSVVPQYSYHDDVMLIGSPLALERLQRAISEALQSGQAKDTSFFATDGEGYNLLVICLPDDAMWRVPTSYTADYAHDDDVMMNEDVRKAVDAARIVPEDT